MAPTGSSIPFFSKVKIEKYTNIPPNAPTIIAVPPEGLNGSAVMATKPAIAPFIAIVTSILPVINKLISKAATTPPAAAIFVFKNTWLTAIALPSLATASSEPPLKPNQPNHSIHTPNAAIGIFEPGIGFTEPLEEYFPFLGPKTKTTAKAAAAPQR